MTSVNTRKIYRINGQEVPKAKFDRWHAARAEESRRVQRARLEEEQRDATIERITGVPPSTSFRCAYGSGSEFSWFVDVMTCAQDAQRGPFATEPAWALPSGPLVFKARGGYEAARNRLDTIKRAGETTAATTLGEFVVGGAPPSVRAAFAEAARARAVIAPLFMTGEIKAWQKPGSPKEISVPRMTTGASTAVQATENSTVSNTDHVSAEQVSPIASIAGYAHASQQLLDLQGGILDDVISRDLGASYAASLDSELASGSGSGGHTIGLLNVSGAVTGSYADASPDSAAMLAAIAQLWRTQFTTRGRGATHAIIGPAAAAILLGDPTCWTAGPDGVPALPFGPTIVPSSSLPVNLGAGTNESRIILVVADDLVLATDGATVTAGGESSGTFTSLNMDIVAHGNAGAGHKLASSVAILAGTGLVAT